MQRSVHMARLGIALISFANATAALTLPRVPAATCAGAIEAASYRRMDVKVQRPPRVPRREPFVADPAEAPAAGGDA